jgi:cytochrome c peroxidase
MSQPNQPPVLNHRVSQVRLSVDHPLNYDVTQGGTLFTDPDRDPLTYAISLGGTEVSSFSVNGTNVVGQTRQEGWLAVSIVAKDGRGGETMESFNIQIGPNLPPRVAKANADQLLSVGAAVSYDVTQAGTAFEDIDGDPITYRVSLSRVPHGLSVSGATVVGTFDSVGAVRVTVMATDSFNGTTESSFLLAAPAPEPGRPNLPTTSLTYDDAKLPLPHNFYQSRQTVVPFWDTTPANNPTTDAGATLGRVLFYDQRLSLTNTHSCGSCHEQAHGFTVPTRFGEGILGEPTKRNPMGLTEVRYSILDQFFNDMRVSTLETLALMPIQDPVELGNSMPRVIEKLSATDFYPPLFNAAFGSPEITSDRIARALAQFLRSLISYNAKVDAYSNPPNGQQSPPLEEVFTPQELTGRQVFLGNSCFFCHSEDIQASFETRNNGLDEVFTDPGSGDGRFRAASLRNVEFTAPYMHDGRFATLRDVVDHYDHGVKVSPQLDSMFQNANGGARQMNLTEEQKQGLIAFLNAMTDEAFLRDPRFSDPFP